MNLLISYFMLWLNLASSLELCSFQCFCLTLSNFLRINDTISSVFVFILLFYCVFFPVFVFLYDLPFPAFAFFYCLLLVRQLIFLGLVISFCISFQYLWHAFSSSCDSWLICSQCLSKWLQDRFMDNVEGCKVQRDGPLFLLAYLNLILSERQSGTE